MKSIKITARIGRESAMVQNLPAIDLVQGYKITLHRLGLLNEVIDRLNLLRQSWAKDIWKRHRKELIKIAARQFQELTQDQQEMFLK